MAESPKLIDHAVIFAISGDGGNGSNAMRREKFVPNGGPDGGDGGAGGDIYVVADSKVNTLWEFRKKIHWKADSGNNGVHKRQNGKDGKNLVIRVPPGTVVFDRETNACLGDLYREGMKVLVARGGRGGRGNVHFKSAHNKAPRFADRGEPGEERGLVFDLQMLAEVGIVGFPNAGKSSLLGCISRAEPKVGDYPFTTLQPILGVVQNGFEGIVMADLPGIVEGAAQGVGLGTRFLRHVERTRLLLHLLDLSQVPLDDPMKYYKILRTELSSYSQELAFRPEILAVNKIELPDFQEHLEALRAVCRQRQIPLYEISCHEKLGLPELLEVVFNNLNRSPLPATREIEALPAKTYRDFRVEFEVDVWRVFGAEVETLVRTTDHEDPEAIRRLQRKLLGWGVEDELIAKGCVEGDTVRIGKHLFDFEPTPDWLREGTKPALESDVRASQSVKLDTRKKLRVSAKAAIKAHGANVGTRGRGRKKKIQDPLADSP
jgi:GTP-binding protein